MDSTNSNHVQKITPLPDDLLAAIYLEVACVYARTRRKTAGISGLSIFPLGFFFGL